MATVYRFEINVNTGEIQRYIDTDHPDGFDEKEIDYAEYNEDGFENVYSESLKSADWAEHLAYSKCVELMNKFKMCADKIFTEGLKHDRLH